MTFEVCVRSSTKSRRMCVPIRLYSSTTEFMYFIGYRLSQENDTGVLQHFFSHTCCSDNAFAFTWRIPIQGRKNLPVKNGFEPLKKIEPLNGVIFVLRT